MANSRYEYVKDFELADALLPKVWIGIRIDGRGFTKFAQAHHFEKPNDVRALNLMNMCAKALVEDQPDCILAYGASDEYSFVLRKATSLYQRRASKLLSVFVSFFASNFVLNWPSFFPDTKIECAPAFDGRAVCYPTDKILRDYLAWRQVDCHINSQYNTCYWNLVKFGKTPADAQAALKGTQADFKNQLLFRDFGINHATLPAIFRKGTCKYRKEVEEGTSNDAPGSSSSDSADTSAGPETPVPAVDKNPKKKAQKRKTPCKDASQKSSGAKKRGESKALAEVQPMSVDEKRDLSLALCHMEAEHLSGIVDIIKKQHAALMSNDEELELDIDAL